MNAILSHGHATRNLAVSVRPSVASVFLHYCPYPFVRDWSDVYPALFFTSLLTRYFRHQMLLSPNVIVIPNIPPQKKKRMAHGLVAWLLKWFLWAGGIPLRRKRVLGRKVTQERAAIIVAAPHASIWDAGTVSLACGMPSFVSRVENRSVPIIGSKGS